MVIGNNRNADHVYPGIETAFVRILISLDALPSTTRVRYGDCTDFRRRPFEVCPI
jgi:hypothetical protein